MLAKVAMRIARLVAASAAITLDAFGESPQIAAVSGRFALSAMSTPDTNSWSKSPRRPILPARRDTGAGYRHR